ncbi:hypothetical protein O3P69_018816 [Scylla paramamosain]|uniref:Uncharacterized protein n=1 Tax=Scylla paramamosain TaxID=85552 RepID=A0AAW0STQ1_SCYPA
MRRRRSRRRRWRRKKRKEEAQGKSESRFWCVKRRNEEEEEAQGKNSVAVGLNEKFSILFPPIPCPPHRLQMANSPLPPAHLSPSHLRDPQQQPPLCPMKAGETVAGREQQQHQ